MSTPKAPFDESCCDGGETCYDGLSAQPCGCDPRAKWVCQTHTLENYERGIHDRAVKNALGYTQELTRPTNPKQDMFEIAAEESSYYFSKEGVHKIDSTGMHLVSEEVGASKPGQDHMAEADAIVNGDRMAAYGSPRPAYEAMAQVWSGLIDHKLKEPLTAEDVVILLTGMKLRRECLKHKRDNIVDSHGYLLVLAHVREDHGQ